MEAHVSDCNLWVAYSPSIRKYGNDFYKEAYFGLRSVSWSANRKKRGWAYSSGINCINRVSALYLPHVYVGKPAKPLLVASEIWSKYLHCLQFIFYVARTTSNKLATILWYCAQPTPFVTYTVRCQCISYARV